VSAPSCLARHVACVRNPAAVRENTIERYNFRILIFPSHSLARGSLNWGMLQSIPGRLVAGKASPCLSDSTPEEK
jgi:hypothetical protein